MTGEHSFVVQSKTYILGTHQESISSRQLLLFHLAQDTVSLYLENTIADLGFVNACPLVTLTEPPTGRRLPV
jgi:hypothetical protein